MMASMLSTSLGLAAGAAAADAGWAGGFSCAARCEGKRQAKQSRNATWKFDSFIVLTLADFLVQQQTDYFFEIRLAEILRNKVFSGPVCNVPVKLSPAKRNSQ